MFTESRASSGPAPGLATTARQIWAVLSRAERRTALALIAVMVLAMLFELLGIGLFIPAIAVLTSPDVAATFPRARPLLDALGNPARGTLIIAGMVALVCVYAAKAVVLAFLAWRQSRFAYGVQARLSRDLLRLYLAQPYAFHLQRNSAQLIRNSMMGVDTFAEYGLAAGQKYVSEYLVLAGICALLLFVEPAAALIVLPPLAFIGWSLQKLTRERARRWGIARQQHEALRIQHLQQGLAGVKEVKLLGREDAFTEKYHAHNEQGARAAQLHHTLLQLPRIALELLAITAMAALAIWLLARGRTPEALLPTLGLFAAAAFRMIPSVNRAVLAYQDLRFGAAAVTAVHSDMDTLAQVDDAAVGGALELTRELRVENVSYTYAGAGRPAIEHVALRIGAHESVAIVGASGAGKSTLVDVLLGLLPPAEGRVTVDGRDIRTALRSWQKRIGYVPQSIFLADDSVRANVALGVAAAEIDDDAVWSALRSARLDGFVRSLPHGLDSTIGERGVRLSGGQRQRIGIARALLHDPALLVLDEATSSLDTQTEGEIMDAIRDLRGSRALLVVAHRTSTVTHCERLYRLSGGRLLEHGSTQEILTASEVSV